MLLMIATAGTPGATKVIEALEAPPMIQFVTGPRSRQIHRRRTVRALLVFALMAMAISSVWLMHVL